MAKGTLILLTDSLFADTVSGALHSGVSDAGCRMSHAATQADLDQILATGQPPFRLVAFCTGVIVPAAIISACEAGAFNIHPGPPAYPGLFPSVFAIYGGAETFGTTVHHMTDEIDGGDIVHTSSFGIPDTIDRAALDALAFEHALSVTRDLAPALCDLSQQLPPNGEAWQSIPRTRREFESLCCLPEGVDEREFNRRYRAVGEGPDHALSIILYGHRFKLDNLRPADISRGGQNAS